MMNKKISSLVVSLALVGILNCSSNVSALSVGASCSKIHSTKTSGNMKFECVKLGKKLVWGKGTKISKGFVAKIPISLPVAQNGTITFSNILDHVAEIPKTAWQKVQDTIALSSVPALKHDIFVGPNTELTISNGITHMDSVIESNTRLWSGFTLTKHLTLVYYNLTDEQWAEQKVRDVWIAKGYVPSAVSGALNATKINCEDQSRPGVGGASLGFCRGGSAGAVTNSDDSFGSIAEGDIERPDTYGTKLAHEITHTVQAAQWIGNANCHNEGQNCFRSGLVHAFAPCWIHEGQPNSIGLMAASTEFSIYMKRGVRPSGKDISQKVTDFSAVSLRSYLYGQNPSTCYQNGPLYQQGYGPGAMAVEALVAIGGPQATMALFALGAQGQDFSTAFMNVYGISWSDASTILSNVLAAEYSVQN
jgi:hypothetical protein